VFLGALADQCRALPGDELTSLDRVLERKLYDIDRTDIQAVTDGSDDGFLYARGFIVAMGRDFYDAVVGDPQVAVLDAECEVRDAAERNIRRITLTCPARPARQAAPPSNVDAARTHPPRRAHSPRIPGPHPESMCHWTCSLLSDVPSTPKPGSPARDSFFP
jgi:hypothetical protein